MPAIRRLCPPLLAYGARVRIHKLVMAASLVAALPLAADAAQKTLVALGDSLTQGYGLPEDDGLVPQLQAWLSAHGADVKVVNAGVSGDTTAGGLARTDWALVPQTSAVMVLLGGNDLLRGLPPEAARTNLDAILAKTEARHLPTLLIPMVAPDNYGAAYKAAFDAIYPEIAAKHGALLAQPYFAPILGAGDRATALRTLMQDDGIHPNEAGVARAVTVLGPKVLELLAEVH